jgi:hypothetical protein
MRANYFPGSVITESPPSVILVAESADDREKLRNLVESIPEIVIGENRCVRTGETCVVELGKPRTNTQQLDDSQMVDEWNKDPAKWAKRPLHEQLEILRKYHCTGPCGQSSGVIGDRNALDKALREAKSIVEFSLLRRKLDDSR